VPPSLISKFDPDQKRPFFLLGRIQYNFGRLPRTTAATQSGIILMQANSFHPSVPDAEVGTAVSVCEATGAGRDSMCA
jgi:hypothetical protein